MPSAVCFTIPGEPRSKGRPRFGKNGRAYTPASTKIAEKAVEDAYRIATPGPNGWRLFRGRLSVEIVFVCKHRRRRDLDNMGKLVLDALNGAAYLDDEQIDSLHLERLWTEGDPETRVLIWSLEEESV